MRQDERVPAPWLLRPALDLALVAAVASVAGALLMSLQGAVGRPWIDGPARWIVGLHDHPLLNRAMAELTSLGGEMSLFAAGCILVVAAYRRFGTKWARFCALVMVGGLALDNIVKPLVGRERPVFDQLVGGNGGSFPSGHATATTALLFALALYLAQGATRGARRRIWAAAVAGSVLMGVTRIYLGVHWPTDVIAGLAIGAVWTFLCARSQGILKAPARSRTAWSPRNRLLLATALLALVGLACSPSNPDQPRTTANASPSPNALPAALGSDYEVDIDPANFVDRIDNPYFSLEPGTVFRLKGVTDEAVERETITVTARTKEILGVETTVVKDVMRVDGEVVEHTFDWYAQDLEGNVWYFGEDTAEWEDGRIVSRSGSWESGVDGALPGIIMNADPQVTDSHRQEYYAGEAEDMFWVVARDQSVSVPFGDFDNAIRTLEWTPLEPRIVVEKFYAPGVGLLSEHALSGGKENVQLLDIARR
ncbi:MAG: phosphatase PAP2 family protein [Actinomycetota bacterium]